MMRPQPRFFLEIFLLFITSLMLFTWGLSTQEIIGFDSRFYLFAEEMWQNGFTWFPTTYSAPYPDYPVTSTLLIYLSAKCFGTLNKFTAVFPTALASAITIVLTYLIGCLHSRRLGYLGVLFLFLTFCFIKSARGISLDMYPTCLTAACFYLVYSADILKRPKRVYWAFPLMMLSFAFRGPIGVVIPAGVVCIYYLLDLRIRAFFLGGFAALLILIAGSTSLLAIAYHVGGLDFVSFVLNRQFLGRMNNEFQPFYFYFVYGLNNYAMSLPVAFLMLVGFLYERFYLRHRIPSASFFLKLTGWLLVILFGMCVPADKKIRYVLPMVPAAALMAAYLFTFDWREKYFAILAAIMRRFFFYLPLLLCLMLEFGYFYNQTHFSFFNPPYLGLAVFLLVMQAVNFLIVIMPFALRSAKRVSKGNGKTHDCSYFETVLCTSSVRTDDPQASLVADTPFSRCSLPLLTIAAASFFATYLFFIEPLELHIERSQAFVVAMEKIRADDKAQLVFYQEHPDGLPIKYLIHMTPDARTQTDFQFTDIFASIVAMKGPVFIVMSESAYLRLSQEEKKSVSFVGKDRIGHRKVVVLKKQ